MKKNPVSKETIVLFSLFILVFVLFSIEMGIDSFLSTTLATAYYLLLEVALYIMAVAVLTGAIAGIFSEFGIVALLNYILYPIVRFAYRLPGVAGIGAVSAYLSDNPAVIALLEEKEFKKAFKPYQIPILVNLGTSFGMGLVIAVYFMSLGNKFNDFGSTYNATFIGIFSAIIGSIVSVMILTYYSKKHFNINKNEHPIKNLEGDEYYRYTREGSFINRFLESALDGGKNGVNIGLSIIPGILIISTFVIMLTNTASNEGYTGAMLEGVGLLPMIGEHIMFIIKPIFGFESPEAIAFPLISLGSAGAATGIVDGFIANNFITVKDIAVFTAIGTTWSGYLSTHVGMMDAVKARPLTGKAILAHTIGGLVSGIVANYIYILLEALSII